MQGNETFKLAVRELSNVVEETLLANNLDKKDLDWLCATPSKFTYYYSNS